MFTGIIRQIGQVTKINHKSTGLKLIIDIGQIANEINPSDSLAVNGACLTVTAKSGTRVSFDVVAETLKRTNLGTLKTKSLVNIEPALRVGEPLGGHFLQGHIDGTGLITKKNKSGPGYLMEISTPPNLIRSMIEKGSVAVDGVSLTIVNLKKDRFSVALIPFTLTHTNLGRKSRHERVNLEADMIGKWVKKLLNNQTNSNEPASPSGRSADRSLERLVEEVL